MRVELHLMVKEPLNELKKWQSVEQVVRILVHYECMDNLKDIFPTLHAYGWDISIVLNPDTPIAALDPYLPEIKGVMTILISQPYAWSVGKISLRLSMHS